MASEMNDSVESYRHLWEAPPGKYFLIQTMKGSNTCQHCVIYNKDTKCALIIEDDLIAKFVMEMMVDNGVPVVDAIP